MPARGLTFAAVRKIGLALPEVEETTSWGAPTLKVRGTMFVCMAVNKAAEPNTLVVMMDFPDRDALVAEDPDTYYLKDHYLNYPCVLVRLSRVNPDALRDLVGGAWRWANDKARRKKQSRRRSPAARRTPQR